MATIEIRQAVPGDWETYRDLRLRALADSPDAYCSTLTRETGFTRDDWLLRLAEPSFLAFVDGVVAACGAGYVAGGVLDVVAMWTAPEFRGLGLGRRILDLVVAWGRERALPVRLDVTVGNDPARRLYERYGFVATGETEPLRPGSAHRMERMRLP